MTRNGCFTLARMLALKCSSWSSTAPIGLSLSNAFRLPGRMATCQLASIVTVAETTDRPVVTLTVVATTGGQAG